jgi:hypothetical protein
VSNWQVALQKAVMWGHVIADALIRSSPFVAVLFLFDWAGSRGALLPWGDPRSFGEALSHLPIWVAISVGVQLWWNRRHRT